MLSKMLSGSMVEKKLWGIDDPATVRLVQRLCYERSALSGKRLIIEALLAGASGGIVMALLLLSGPRGWHAHLALGIAIGAAIYITLLRRKRRARRELPKVLQSIGRCIRCGYKLEDRAVHACPRCGCGTQ